MKRKIAALLLILALVFSVVGCQETSNPEEIKVSGIEKDIAYSQPGEVAEYLYLYNQLPPNYLTKKEATALGWESQKGNLWEVTDKMSIGGDFFGNREGRLPTAEGRKWYECDVNYQGGYREAERLVYSNDGLIFYTEDHYETFTEITFEER